MDNKQAQTTGNMYKYLFYASSITSRILDTIVVGSSLTILMCWLTGAPFMVIYLAIGLVALLIRLGITAFTYNRGRYSPIETEYRVTLLEDQVSKLVQ